jgi:hypothetical protein
MRRMVHGAIYDAVNAIAGTPYQPYLIAPPANGTESTSAGRSHRSPHLGRDPHPYGRRGGREDRKKVTAYMVAHYFTSKR